MREALIEHGFAVLDAIVEPDEASWLVEVVDGLVAALQAEQDPTFQDLTRPFGSTLDGGPAVPQVMAPHQRAPELLDGQFLLRAAEHGRHLLGDDAVTTIAMVVAKPAFSPGVVPWHQDAAYWGHEVRRCAASIWVPLQDVDHENGCLWFVPGSHRGEVLPHRHLGDDEAVHALELASGEAEMAVQGEVAMPLRLGQASVHDGHTIHQSGPNRSDRPRRALVLSVRNPARDIATPGRPRFAWA